MAEIAKRLEQSKHILKAPDQYQKKRRSGRSPMLTPVMNLGSFRKYPSAKNLPSGLRESLVLTSPFGQSSKY